jgi:nucleoside 2-deoxyribosyltransferase
VRKTLATTEIPLSDMTHKANCYFTNETVDISVESHLHFYDLDKYGHKITIGVCPECSKKFNKIPAHIIKGLIINKKWPERALFTSEGCDKMNSIYNGETIIFNDFIATATYPKTPEDKMNSFFIDLFNSQTSDGANINLIFDNPLTWMRNYFANEHECLFYLNGLESEGLITIHTIKATSKNRTINITLKGLNYAIKLQNDIETSNACFIAMAFDDKTKIAREAIKSAIIKSGYDVFIVDEENINSDKTIPDAILAGIKKSKFCIADFTMHKNGVYFESGYAVGLGKQVIYICNEEDFEKAHFDIKQLQHIIYNDSEELENALIHKIEAWIR